MFLKDYHLKLLISIILVLMTFKIYADDEVATTSEKTDWGAMLTYSPYDLWLPGKFGLTAVKFEENRSYELAYQTASYSFDFIIDGLGKISDQRVHLSTRGHTWDGSFNFQYGLYISSTSITLGKTYLGAGVTSDAISVTNLGAMWGFGNKWAWSNGMQLGMDYFRIFYPLTTLKSESDFLDESADESDKEDVKELVDGLSKLPQLTLLHFEVGYRF